MWLKVNIVLLLQEPVFGEIIKDIYPCWLLTCLKSTPIQITARTPVGGYVSGQTINIEICIKNESKKPLSAIRVQLIKVRRKLQR